MRRRRPILDLIGNPYFVILAIWLAIAWYARLPHQGG